MYNFQQFGNMFQQPQFQQPQFPQMNNFQNQSQFITKQVSNIEEAKAFIIDPFNSYLFVDMNAGKIYMKRMNNNGISDFYIFGVTENSVENKNPLEEINKRLENIENKLGGIDNVQSISNDAESKSVFSESNDTKHEKPKPSAVSKGSGND